MRLTTRLMLGVATVLVFAPTDATAQKKQRDRITKEEIQQSSQKDQDLYAVIRALRPHFLEGPRGVRTIGGGMQNPVIVVVDRRRETPDVLLQIMAPQVEEVRYLDPSRAQNQFGVSANGGAIVVKLAGSAEGGAKEP